MVLGTVHASEVDYFFLRREKLDCVIFHLCHVILLSLPTDLVFSLNTEVYCLCIDEKEVHAFSTVVFLCVLAT